MTQQVVTNLPALLPTSQQEKALASLARSAETRAKLVCTNLLVGETRTRALAEAKKILPEILMNTQALAIYGNSALDAVNDLSDQMTKNRPSVEMPELNRIMRDLNLRMSGINRKYDPSDPGVLKQYQQAKSGLFAAFHWGKTFFQLFQADIRSMEQIFDLVVATGEKHESTLLRSVSFFDEAYARSELERGKLIFVIAVMEQMRNTLADMASKVEIGDTDKGDRGVEEQARLAELATLLDNRIVAFKARLWVSWGMAPMLRNMRAISLGLYERVNQTISITIPTMKEVIGIWMQLSAAEQAAQFNQWSDASFNQSLVGFAHAAGAAVPLMADSLATPSLSPSTITAWCESVRAQGEGMKTAIVNGEQRRAELDQAMIEGKKVIDTTTLEVNQARLEHILAKAREAEQQTIEITRSVPA